MVDDPRSTVERQWWPAVICCGAYLVLAMVDFGHFGSLGPSHVSGYGAMDVTVQIWWLAWTANALPYVHDIFLGQAQNYPLGQNFGVNGSMVALGVIFMPITKLFGVVVTWNIALRLALAASAASMCLVLRRWTTWWPAAFLGGLLYGFSAYNQHIGAYLFLIFVPLPPLIFLLLHEILVRQRWRPRATGAFLGLVCAIQFFISTEVLASTVVMGTIAVALFVVTNRRILVERWRYAVTAFAYSFGVACLLLFYPVAFTFAGPQHINGPPASPGDLANLPGDLLSSIVPISNWLNPKPLTVVPLNIYFSGYMYLGLPLIVTLALFAVFLRKRRMILFSGTMALISFVIALGSPLYVDGHRTSVHLPFALFVHLPFVNGFLAARFSLYTALFASGMFAIGIDELRRRLKRLGRMARLPPKLRVVAGALALGAIAVFVTIPLVPNQTQRTSPINVPTFFTSAAVESIPPGSVVLAYPYPDLTGNNPYYSYLLTNSVMVDQAVADMRFKLIGGFGWFPSPTGRFGTTSPALLEPQSVQAFFDVAFSGVETSAQRVLLSKRNLTNDLREFLRKYNVQTVIVLHERDSATVSGHVTAAIGPPIESRGVTVWLHVRHRLAAATT